LILSKEGFTFGGDQRTSLPGEKVSVWHVKMTHQEAPQKVSAVGLEVCLAGLAVAKTLQNFVKTEINVSQQNKTLTGIREAAKI
jgi:hypothetical protein